MEWRCDLLYYGGVICGGVEVYSLVEWRCDLLLWRCDLWWSGGMISSIVEAAATVVERQALPSLSLA